MDGGGTTAEETCAAALRFFGSVFGREIDAELLAKMREAGPAFGETLGEGSLADLEADDGQALAALEIEYCRLFIGPRGHLPPAESVVLGEGRFQGVATEAVIAFYRESGIAVAEDAKVVPDHISMELDCLALLEESGRHEKAAMFARAHVLRWLPALARHVERTSTLAFYRVAIKGLEEFLTELYCTDESMRRGA